MPSNAVAGVGGDAGRTGDVHGQAVAAAGEDLRIRSTIPGACSQPSVAEVERPRRSAAPCRRADGIGPVGLPCTPSKPASAWRVRGGLGPVRRGQPARPVVDDHGRQRVRGLEGLLDLEHLRGLGAAGQPRRGRRSSRRRSACRPTGRRCRPAPARRPSTRNLVRRPVSRRAADPVMISPSCASRRAGDAIDRPPRASTTFAPALRKPQKRCPARQSRVQCSAGERSPADTASGPTALRPPAQAGA